MPENAIVYLNGRFVEASRACVAADDRGFRFGDGVFETIPFYDGVPYQWPLHYDRLLGGLAALRIDAPPLDWIPTLRELMRRNAPRTGFIRIAVSRGSGSAGYRPLPGNPPGVVMEILPRGEHMPAGTALWLSRWRKPPPECLPAGFKLAQGVNSTLALMEAGTHDCGEALLLTPGGALCEAASGNLFWVADGRLYTPALSTGCVNGTARQAVIRLYETVIEAAIEATTAPPEALHGAEAVFLTNAHWGILPVSALEPKGWCWPAAHPLTTALQAALAADIRQQREACRDVWQ